MKNIIYMIIGILIGTVAAFTVFLVINKNNNSNNEEIEYKEVVTDEQIVNEFLEIDNSKDENKIKTGFTNIVDFIFYGKEIKGKTFNDLKDETKLKLMKIGLSIDSKIDDYFPNYKSNLKEKYDKVKSKIAELYINTTTKICDNNERLCINAKNDFQSLKESFGITFEYIKKYGNMGLDKIKDWYENFKD